MRKGHDGGLDELLDDLDLSFDPAVVDVDEVPPLIPSGGTSHCSVSTMAMPVHGVIPGALALVGYGVYSLWKKATGERKESNPEEENPDV